MTDQEIERMTLCIAQMAALLEAGDRAAFINVPGEYGQCNRTDLEHYTDRARALYEAAATNVAGRWPRP